MSKRTGNRSGKRGRGKHNRLYSKQHGTHLAKQMIRRQKEEAHVKPPKQPLVKEEVIKPDPIKADPTKGFF